MAEINGIGIFLGLILSLVILLVFYIKSGIDKNKGKNN